MSDCECKGQGRTRDLSPASLLHKLQPLATGQSWDPGAAMAESLLTEANYTQNHDWWEERILRIEISKFKTTGI